MLLTVAETRQTPLQGLSRLLVDSATAPNHELTDLQWSELVELAGRERVGALLYRRLRLSGDLHHLPEQARAALSGQYFLSAAHNKLFSSELARIAEKFVIHGISCILLKGAALAHSLYDEPALRPMNDLDLLILPDALETAVSQLRGLGYEALPASHLEHAAWLDQAANHHVHLRNVSVGVSVELHWRLIGGKADWRSPDINWFWEQKQPASSIPHFYALSPEACLLYLAAHTELQHGASSSALLWYHDLYLLMVKHTGELDWALIIDKAAEFNWADALFRALESVERFFGLALPVSEVSSRVPQDERAVRYLEQKTSLRGLRTQETLRDLGTFKGLARLRVLLALVFPSAKYMRRRYKPKPAWLWPLYYPYRWGDIVVDGITSLLGIGKK